MKAVQGKTTAAWLWLTDEPAKIQLTVLLLGILAVAALVMLALAFVTSSAHPIPFAGLAGGGTGGSG